MGNVHGIPGLRDARSIVAATLHRQLGRWQFHTRRARPSSGTHSHGPADAGFDYLDGFFPLDDWSCVAAFCFLLLSLSFLPPLSPIVASLRVESHSSKSTVCYLSPLASTMSNPPLSIRAALNEKRASVTLSSARKVGQQARGTAGLAQATLRTILLSPRLEMGQGRPAEAWVNARFRPELPSPLTC